MNTESKIFYTLINSKSENTKSENLKSRVIEIFNTLLNDYESDVETGIEEGIYDIGDNKKSRAFIEEAKKVIVDFASYVPEVYIFVEGGNIQGISATEFTFVNKFDMDNYQADPADQEQEITPESWDKMITEKTNAHEIKAVY